MFHLEGSMGPIEAVERFLTDRTMEMALRELWAEGTTVPKVYYPEEMPPGERLWSVDVHQDELNERYGFNRTWTVVSEARLAEDGETADSIPNWMLAVNEPFSDEVVIGAVTDWLTRRGHPIVSRSGEAL